MNPKFYNPEWNPLEDLLAGRELPREYKKKGKWRRILWKYLLLSIASREDRKINKLYRKIEKQNYEFYNPKGRNPTMRRVMLRM